MNDNDKPAPAVDQGASLRIESETVDSAVLVQVHGEIDMLTADNLEAQLMSAITAATTAVVIDLTGVEFLGSAGLGALLAARAQADAAHIRMRIVAATHVVLRPLEITGVAASLDIHPNLTAALREPDIHSHIS